MNEIFYLEYTFLEKFDIIGQGICYTWRMFLWWFDHLFEPYDKKNTTLLFYHLNGDYFNNAIALEDKDYYIWTFSNWAKNYPFVNK